MIKCDDRQMNAFRYADCFCVLLNQPGLLDFSRHLKCSSGVGDSLETTAFAINSAAFRLVLDSAPLYSHGSRSGRPPFDPVALLKALILLARNSAAAYIRTKLPIRDLLGICRHSFQSRECADETRCGGIAGAGFIEVRDGAADFLGFPEEVFGRLSPFVRLGIVGGGCHTVCLGGDRGDGAASIRIGPQSVIAEGFGRDRGVEAETGDERLDADAVAALAGQRDKPGQVVGRIGRGDDPGGWPAARFADGMTLRLPFAPLSWRWTWMIVPSIGARSKPGFSECSVKMRSNMSFPAQRQKRIHGVMHLLKWGGRSCRARRCAGDKARSQKKAGMTGSLPAQRPPYRAACRERLRFTSPKDRQNQRNNRLRRPAGCASPASLRASRRPTPTLCGCSENA